MHPLLKRSLLFVGAIIVVLALLVWGIGLETIRARQVDLVYLGQQHMILVFSSMFFALLVGIPAGILLSRPAARGIAEYVMQIFNVGNTLPPLAVLALAMVVIGIGDTPAIIALFLASLLPIVRNTYAGLCSVPPSLLEAANGIGITKWQRLRQVELPAAWPVKSAGGRVRTRFGIFCVVMDRSAALPTSITAFSLAMNDATALVAPEQQNPRRYFTSSRSISLRTALVASVGLALSS
jgi:osmoprotectant transport system permease protein